MKAIIILILSFIISVNYSQNHHKKDSVYSYGNLVQINKYDTSKKTIYLKQERTKYNLKQEGLYQHFDSINCLECYTSYGEKIKFIFSNSADLYSYYGIDNEDIFHNLLPVKEWKFYDSLGKLERVIIYDSVLRKILGGGCNRFSDENSPMPCTGGYHFDYVPKKITYFSKGIKYREEYYKNGLIINSFNWNKR